MMISGHKTMTAFDRYHIVGDHFEAGPSYVILRMQKRQNSAGWARTGLPAGREHQRGKGIEGVSQVERGLN
jgi:hypothetical protein